MAGEIVDTNTHPNGVVQTEVELYVLSRGIGARDCERDTGGMTWRDVRGHVRVGDDVDTTSVVADLLGIHRNTLRQRIIDLAIAVPGGE